ncbi:outer membrane factor lipoprotein domain-containing protein [Azotobacter armeniacus]
MRRKPLALLGLYLLLPACSGPLPQPDSGLAIPGQWRHPPATATAMPDADWWRSFGSEELNLLIHRAHASSHDIAAALARLRQARATATVEGARVFPELSGEMNAIREQLIGNTGGYGNELGATEEERRIEHFDTMLTVSYELDLWSANRSRRAAARKRIEASERDRAAVQLTVTADVADTYLQVLALREQIRIALLNLGNAEQVLELVEARHAAGASHALELAQQRSLTANQRWQIPRLQQEEREATIVLATLLGVPVQGLRIRGEFGALRAQGIQAGLPSELLVRRPDIARAEAELAAAEGDVRVARAALLPTLNLEAGLGGGAERASVIADNPFPFLTLEAGLTAPIFNAGRLRAEREQALARQEELLHDYRRAIIDGLADVEKALNALAGIERQQRWQREELEQARQSFALAETRYRAGAATLLDSLESQRTLFQAQDQEIQLRLARLQASVSLFKALGGGWRSESGNGRED